MHWKNLSNYEYLGAYSLDKGKDVTLTIKFVKQEMVTSDGGNKKKFIVAYFEEEKVGKVVVKPMVLNKTNCKTIELIYKTGEIEDWAGKRITIYATETRFARDIVPCLRIRNEVPTVQTYNCSVCGKEISKATHDGSLSKYGVALCSQECLKKYQEENNQ